MEDLKMRIERCRRLARQVTDDDVRHSLEELAQEYEAQLQSGDQGFMLKRH